MVESAVNAHRKRCDKDTGNLQKRVEQRVEEACFLSLEMNRQLEVVCRAGRSSYFKMAEVWYLCAVGKYTVQRK